MPATTIKELLERNPAWANMPLVWSDPRDGHMEFVGASASIHQDTFCDKHMDEDGWPTCEEGCPDSYPVVSVEGN